MVFMFSDIVVDWSADTTGAQKLPTRRSTQRAGSTTHHGGAGQGMQRERERREIPERAPKVHPPRAQAPPQAHFASGRHTAGLACVHNMSPSSDARTMRNRMYERDGVVFFLF